MTISWGPMREDDAERWAELIGAIEAADQAGEHYEAADLAEDLGNPLIDLAEGTLAARDGDRIVAFAYLPVRQSADQAHLMSLWGGVHPGYRRRGFGRRVVDWALAAAPALHRRTYPGKPLELQLHTNESNPWAKALAEQAGFAEVRWFFHMERDLSAGIAAHRVPDGLEIATWTPELDPGAMGVRNEAFLDHWGSIRHTRESWRQHITGTRAFRSDASFVALSGDRAVGILITHYFPADTEVTGVPEAWIQIIGTLKEWRGKGVASALIAHALTAFRSQGYGKAGLSVDATNPTGALGVYERSGFEVAQRTSAYSRSLTPA